MNAASLHADQAHTYGRGRVHTPPSAAARAIAVLPDLAERLTLAVLADALREALPAYWVRRADELEAAGSPSATATAVECRRHAWLLSLADPDTLASEALEAVIA